MIELPARWKTGAFVGIAPTTYRAGQPGTAQSEHCWDAFTGGCRPSVRLLYDITFPAAVACSMGILIPQEGFNSVRGHIHWVTSPFKQATMVAESHCRPRREPFDGQSGAEGAAMRAKPAPPDKAQLTAVETLAHPGRVRWRRGRGARGERSGWAHLCS